MLFWLIYDEADVEKNRWYIQMYETECALRAVGLTLLIRQKLRINASPVRQEEIKRMSETGLSEKAAVRHCKEREPDMVLRDASAAITYEGRPMRSLSRNICPNASTAATYEGKPITLPDAAINRSRDAYLSLQLEWFGVPVYNNSLVATVGNDKGRLYAFLRGKDIPMMETVVCTTETGKGALPYPCVVKSCGGHGGSEVFLVHDDAEYDAACDRIAQNQIIVQRVASETGKDLRVYVIGNEIVAGMLRTSETDFRSNFSLGGHARPHTLTEEEETLVRKIMRHFTFGLAGIDLIYDNGRPVLNEIEDVVGARMLYAHTDINLVGRYVDYMISCLKKAEKGKEL